MKKRLINQLEETRRKLENENLKPELKAKIKEELEKA